MAQTLIGTVTSDKRDKTITVSITSRETHPLYRKQYSHTRKYTAHDEKNEAHLGDKVEIEACRPFSKTVSYKLVKVLEKSHGTVALKEDINTIEGVNDKLMTEQRSSKVESSLSNSGEAARTDFNSEGVKG